ncbi:holo-[acyl-carrier-protein] synthase [Undibacterium sp. YM2]|uniref:holo-ACP synthase n=1 Tax=Undibacterium sp. YM2 TaxID=2058625 RepID=UPI001331F56C|nr:holo-ACP synthase [Undibacterium sp. YM2]BBB66250.1 holo-[acyl-carrier-protein] synthase [Undibacterium sp. YM2]
MIYGIGTDIVQISRMQEAIARNGERFAEKILGPEELAIYRERKALVEARGLRYLATRFAAKEAFSKAVGMGMRDPMNWHAMQTLNNDQGQPVVQTNGNMQQWMQERHLQARISVSDETDYAIAFVIIELNNSC